MSEGSVSRAEFDALLDEFHALKQKLDELQSQDQPGQDESTDEVLQIIAAAVAAYVGKRATIKVIRRVSEYDQWRMQGRAVLQGSHNMARIKAVNTHAN